MYSLSKILIVLSAVVVLTTVIVIKASIQMAALFLVASMATSIGLGCRSNRNESRKLEKILKEFGVDHRGELISEMKNLEIFFQEGSCFLRFSIDSFGIYFKFSDWLFIPWDKVVFAKEKRRNNFSVIKFSLIKAFGVKTTISIANSSYWSKVPENKKSPE